MVDAEHTDVRPPVISEALAQQLLAYRGQWVAILDGQIVAVASSVTTLFQKTETAGISEPLVVRVPRVDGRRRI